MKCLIQSSTTKIKIILNLMVPRDKKCLQCIFTTIITIISKLLIKVPQMPQAWDQQQTETLVKVIGNWRLKGKERNLLMKNLVQIWSLTMERKYLSLWIKSIKILQTYKFKLPRKEVWKIVRSLQKAILTFKSRVSIWLLLNNCNKSSIISNSSRTLLYWRTL